MYITIAEWKFLYNCSVQIKCLEPILDYVHLVRRLVNPNRVGTSEATRYVGTREIMNFKLLFCDGGRHLGQNLRPFWKVKIEVKILPQKVAHLRATTTAADASAATLKHTKERLKQEERERVKVNVEIELFVEGLYFVRSMNCRCVWKR